MTRLFVAAVSAVSLLIVGLGPVRAQTPDRPVPGYGAHTALPDAGEQPDPTRVYEVIFDVSIGGSEGQPSRGLDRVARFINILAASGVDSEHRRIVAVVHGAATTAVMSDEAWAKRHDGNANPSSTLVTQLIAAGVDLRICGQAMTGNGIDPSELTSGVSVDLAALMTTVHFQQRGYVLVVN